MKQPDPYLHSICQQIELVHGHSIKTIADAQKLAAAFHNKKIHLSPHTLGRLYGVVKPFRKPFKDTLNSLAHFLNYADWDDFCVNQTNIPFDPNFFLTEATDGFSLAVLQLALVSQDKQALSAVLAKIDLHCPLSLQIAAAEMLGSQLRLMPENKELLQLLASNPNGQRLFYECYVDEDDENNYYSNALRDYYLPQIDNPFRKLFVYAFLASKSIRETHKPSPYLDLFWETVRPLDRALCHFHEKSRWFEMLILQDGVQGNLSQTWKTHLDEALEELRQHNPYEQAWILARLLKALLWFGYKNELFVHEKLNETIDVLMRNQKKGQHSIALYALQLFWLYRGFGIQKKELYAPFRIHSTWFQNEGNEKKAIEFGISFLFASGENKTIIQRNLSEFCRKTANEWVTQLVLE